MQMQTQIWRAVLVPLVLYYVNGFYIQSTVLPRTTKSIARRLFASKETIVPNTRHKRSSNNTNYRDYRSTPRKRAVWMQFLTIFQNLKYVEDAYHENKEFVQVMGDCLLDAKNKGKYNVVWKGNILVDKTEDSIDETECQKVRRSIHENDKLKRGSMKSGEQNYHVIYDDICKSHSEFEQIETGINTERQQIIVHPKTYIWTTRCCKCQGACSKYNHNSKCMQKRGWTQVYAKSNYAQQWSLTWIETNTSCNCVVPITV